MSERRWTKRVLSGIVILLALYANVTAVNTDQIVGLAPELAQQETGLQEGDLIYKVDGYRTYLAGDAALFCSTPTIPWTWRLSETANMC